VTADHQQRSALQEAVNTHKWTLLSAIDSHGMTGYINSYRCRLCDQELTISRMGESAPKEVYPTEMRNCPGALAQADE